MKAIRKCNQFIYTLLALVLLLLLSACIAACNDQSEPSRAGNYFSATMNGAEVTADGVVVQTEEFTLTGTIYDNGDDRDTIALEPIEFSQAGIFLRFEEEYTLHEHPYLHAAMVSYLAQRNRYVDVDLGLKTDFSECIIIVDNRIFVGSTDPDVDPQSLLELYKDVLK